MGKPAFPSFLISFAVFSGLWLLLSYLLLPGRPAVATGAVTLLLISWAVHILAAILLLHRLAGRQLKAIRQQLEAKHESMNLLDLALSTLEETVLILDPETGTIIKCNATIAKMFGYTAEELLGRDTQLLHQNREAFAKFENEVRITTGNMGFFKTECELRRKNGENFPAELFVRPNRKSGGPFYVVYVIRDLSEKKRREEEAARIQRLESIGLLAGGIAHDFNNMLTAILGNINLAKMELPASSKAHSILADSESATNRAMNLAIQLLAFAKGGEPDRRIFNPGESIAKMAEFHVRGFNINCIITISSGLWPVEADEGQLGQVIGNLVINAAQAMPAGGNLEVGAENFIIEFPGALPVLPGPFLKLTFRDEGTGISSENLPKIFDPYFTTKDTGSGLGLATSFSIIRKHQGWIDVESHPGCGTLFTVYLPAVPGATRQDRQGMWPLAPVAGRILLMDDETVVRNQAAEMIRALGCDVVCAGDGMETVNACLIACQENSGFDAVILDWPLRGEPDGAVTVQKLREIDKHIRLIAASANTNDPIHHGLSSSGFCSVICKPFTSFELNRHLSAVLSPGAASVEP